MVYAHVARLTVAIAQDICTLINHYLSKVSGGLPESFATFRQAWQDLSFSFVFTVRLICCV